MKSREMFHFGSYYPLIEDLTFKTVVIPLDEPTARAWYKIYLDTPLLPAESHLLAALTSSLDAAIAAVRSPSSPPSGGAFVRLSTRSPKDAPDKLPRARVVRSLRAHLLTVGAEQSLNALAPVDRLPLAPSATAEATIAACAVQANARLLAVRRALFGLAEVGSAREALALLALSVRGLSDLRRALHHAAGLGFQLDFVVREFARFPVEYELRAFVCGGRLCALSQYYADTFVPGIEAQYAQIKAVVAEFFAQHLLPRLGAYPDCVVDLALLLRPDGLPAVQGAGAAQIVRVIELNPFLITTGACLFNWKQDMDVLTGKRREADGSFEFRYLFKPHKSVRHVILQWNHLLDDASQSRYPPAVVILLIVAFLSLITISSYYYYYHLNQ